MLGKGLFFKAKDVVALGGFHPWITIEDPEVGMRFWANGKRLGIIRGSLIEEVPETFADGITQRKRWVAGFFQSLTAPLRAMQFTPWQRFKCWLVFFPCLSLWINAIGIPLGIWALVTYFEGDSILPHWTVWLAIVNLTAFVISMTVLYIHVWRRTKLVLSSAGERLVYMLRVNPLFIMAWWVFWIIPLAIGLRMYLRDEGLVWERTVKINSNTRHVQELTAPVPATEESVLIATHASETPVE